jgi:beta-mannosidase
MKDFLKPLFFIGIIATAALAQQYSEVTDWKMQDSATVGATAGTTISTASYATTGWYTATVPGTVLNTLVDQGVYQDPNYGENMLNIPDLAAQQKRYWFRTTFNVTFAAGQHVWLEIGGINYYATIFVNGTQVGTMYGAFKEAKFDITSIAVSGANCLAVKIRGNYNPGVYHTKQSGTCGDNGGVMSQDGPTFISSQGWDWIPTVADRDMGIWKPVYVRVTGPVTIRHPWIRTTNVTTASATVPLQVMLRNATAAPVTGVVTAIIDAADQFTPQTVTVPANDTLNVNFPSLTMTNPKLWWPNGYGAPNLYFCSINFAPTGAAVSDTVSFQFGVRQYSYSSTSAGYLIINCNGQRILARGGNWGMDDAMKRWNLHKLEAQVKYDREMNFNVIRDWIGGTDREPFYQLCDQNGMMVWEDFWEPHSADAPVAVGDQTNFIANMVDKFYRVRNHACVAVWCERNEVAPTPAFWTALQQINAALDGTRLSQPSSGSNGVHSGGPYTYTAPSNAYSVLTGFHTELGGPTVMSYESMVATFPTANQMPMGNAWWSYHDYCNGNGSPVNFTNAMTSVFGTPSNLQDCATRSQVMNYDDYRAYFEALQAKRFNGATGLLLWMSNCVWPSTMWQTYDYYLEGTGAMYGSMKGAEPIHIMYYGSTQVQVVNNTMNALANYSATATTYNLNGTKAGTANTASVNVAADAASNVFGITAGTSTPYFLDLKLRDPSGNVVSKNFYTFPNDGVTNISGLLTMTKTTVPATADAAWTKNGTTNTVTLKVYNAGSVCAISCRLMLTQGTSGTRVLPVHFNDNYFSLIPGDTQSVSIQFDDADLAGQAPTLTLSGINVNQTTYKIGGVVPVSRSVVTQEKAGGLYATFNGTILKMHNVALGSPWQVSMINMKGQTILSTQGIGNGEAATISTNRLRPGIYIAVLKSAGDVFRSMVTISDHAMVR